MTAERLLHARPCAENFTPCTGSSQSPCEYPLFIDEDAEDQKESVIYLRPCSWASQQPGFDPRAQLAACSGPQTPAETAQALDSLARGKGTSWGDRLLCGENKHVA